MRYKFRDKLVLAFVVLLLATVVPVLIVVNSQIETISTHKIEQDLQTTREVFRRFQQSQLATYSEKTANFILTQPEIRAEIATSIEDSESLFGELFAGGETEGSQGDPFGASATAEVPPPGGEASGATPVFGAIGPSPGSSSAAGESSGDPAFGAVTPGVAALGNDDAFSGANASGPSAPPMEAGGTADRGTPAPGGRGTAPPVEEARATDDPLQQVPDGAAGAAFAAAELPEQQNRILSIVEEVGLFQESEVFFLTDFRGELIFNKVDPTVFSVDLSRLPAVYGALQGNEIFTWWGSRQQELVDLGLLPGAAGAPALYQTFLKPVVFGGEIKGLIAIGFALTAADLKDIIGITQAEVAFVADGIVYINSLAGVPAETLLRLAESAQDIFDAGVLRFDVDTEEFLALPLPVESTLSAPVGAVVVYRSKTKEQQVFNNLRHILNVIGITALIAAGLLAYFISHNVSRVVRELFHGVRQVRDGNLDIRLDVRSRDEFGELGQAFNEMTAGLKEKETIRDTFKRYVSSSVVDELLRNAEDIRLGGENKTLTILFSDIAGFTGISERLTPEEVVEFLNEYLSLMTNEIEAQQGIVDKYIGDAVMAFWGAPVPLEDHAVHACRAALNQLKRVAELRERWSTREGLQAFDIRIGLHTGEVVVGNIGSETRMDYTIIGDCVNTASRLEGMNKVYGTNILITEGTYGEVGDAFLARELDLILPVGKSDPVRIYELVGEAHEVDARLAAKHARFAQALAQYRDRRFDAALAAFGELAREWADRAAAAFEQRCRDYLEAPPPPHWDGTYRSVSK